MDTLEFRATDSNRSALLTELHSVRSALRRFAGDDAVEIGQDNSKQGDSALDIVCSRFCLSRFERAILVLCAGIELESEIATLCARAHKDPLQPYPTFALALSVFEDAHWTAITPRGPLRYWHLIELERQAPLLTAPLRIDETILHLLVGVYEVDPHLASLFDMSTSPSEPLASHARVAGTIAMRWSERARGGRYGAVQLCAPLLSVQRSIANTAFSQIGRQMHELPAGSIPTEPRALDELARAWEREAALHASGLFINATDSEPHERIAVGRLIDRVSAPVIVATRGPVPLHARDVHIVYVEPVSHAERRGVWQRALASRGVALDGMLDRLAAQFELEPAAVQEMVSSADLAGDDFGSRLWSEARIASRTDVNDIAERLRTTACFDDLVLPAEQTAVLHDIVAHVRNRTLVYEHWGMAGSATRALGVTALFVGPSGTGKTLAAEVLGNELDLDVLRVDLSAVVSKYIGETEKNLQRAFDAAERSGAILLFDECDALFGKRGEVQFGHDRYANIEVSYLLQRMESYRGLAILTSNMRTAIDPAFMRRLQFVIPFPFPDYDARLAMWRRIFGPGVPTENLDERRLATLSVTGANIRNIAIYAAFLAADAGGAVRMHHLHRAALTECAKIERTPSDVEIGGWI